MEVSIVYMFVMGLVVGIGVLGMFVWGASTGAFEQSEDAKYIVFRDDEED